MKLRPLYTGNNHMNRVLRLIAEKKNLKKIQ